MADAVTQARNAGYTDQEIFAHLTKGREKELAAARDAGYNDTQILNFFLGKGGEQVSGVPDADLKTRRAETARQRESIDNTLSNAEADPARNQSGFENYAAGLGKSIADAGRGLKQIGAQVADVVAPRETTIADLVAERDPSRTAAVTREIDESRRLDQPLMRSPSGSFGNVTGTVAQALPLAFVPGANTIKGSTAIGALIGAAQPVATGESRTQNTLIGAATGGAGPVLARTVGAGYRAAKALTEPFTKAGRDRIAARTLERFGVTAQDVANATSAPTTTGARLTLAEQIQRPEGAAAAARLQDNLRAANPELAAQMTAREGENNAARVATLERLASGKDAAVKARGDVTKPLYEQAAAQTMESSPQLTALLGRPSLKSAWARAKALADERGDSLVAGQDAPEQVINSGVLDASGAPIKTTTPATKAVYSGKALQYLKMAMDDMVDGGKLTGIGAHEANALLGTRAQIMKLSEDAMPALKAARTSYAQMSKPINQADIADELLRRGSANTTDLSGTPRLMPNAITGAARDPAKLMKQATGRDLGAKLEDVLEPDQLAAVNAVVGEVDRGAAVARAANGPGSATAQRLAGTNVIEQTLSRTGLPVEAANSVTLQEVLSRPLNFLYKGAAEPKIQMTLGQLLLNPSEASRVMASIAPPQRAALANVLSSRLLKQAARTALPAAAQANRR